ncbi:hypothetical protein PR248_00430 [Metamycoplasma hyosynoviae]|nr:hypothetical protein [Metamycoplasma hyosynoviae]MDC8913512.1 hypothetical protein [Metamycoplasma hyosynoviae]
MKKIINKVLLSSLLISATPIVAMMSVKCKEPTKKQSIQQKMVIPSDLVSYTNNNYGIFFSEKLNEAAKNITAKAILAELQKDASFANIKKVLEPYAYIDFSNTDLEYYDYKLNLKNTQATKSDLNLFFEVIEKKDPTKIHTVELTVPGFKKDVNVDYNEFAGLKFLWSTTDKGDVISSPEFIDLFKQKLETPEYKGNVKKQLELYKEYCLVNGEFDDKQYDLSFENELKWLHHHGPTNIHINIQWKKKSETKWNQEVFFVYGFDSQKQHKIIDLESTPKSKTITPEEIKDLLLKEDGKDLLLKLSTIFYVKKADNAKFYNYKLSAKYDVLKTGTQEDKDKFLKEIIPNKNTFKLIYDREDKFDSSKKIEEVIEISRLGSTSQFGYLQVDEYFAETDEGDILYNISEDELKTYFDSEEFKKLSTDKQIEKLVKKINDSLKREEFPTLKDINLVNIIEKDKDQYEVSIADLAKIEIIQEKTPVEKAYKTLKLPLKIKNKKDNSEETKDCYIRGFDF